jgi:zinc D-Ala-D-Ala carboxypeptidase
LNLNRYHLLALGGLAVIIVAALALMAMDGEDSASTVSGFPASDCQIEGGAATVRFSWEPAPGASEQRLQVNAIAASGNEQVQASAGPLRPTTNSHSVPGLQTGRPLTWSVDALTPEGWQTTASGSFVACAPPVVLSTGYACEASHASVRVNWSPSSGAGGAQSEQWLQLTPFHHFEPETYGSAGPLPGHAGSYEGRLVANVTYQFRIATETGDGWTYSEVGHIFPQCDYVQDLPCHDLLAPVNKMNRLGPNCVPTDLVALPAAIAMGEQSMRAESARALQGLLNEAASAGLHMSVTSAYRSYQVQEVTFNQNVQQDGLEQAERFSARPGHSEHQLGTTVDVTSASAGYRLVPAFGQTAEGRWLAENAHRFGFIISYPENMEHITGYIYEPWHIRWIGVEMAQDVYRSGLTLHEYLLLRWYG